MTPAVRQWRETQGSFDYKPASRPRTRLFAQDDIRDEWTTTGELLDSYGTAVIPKARVSTSGPRDLAWINLSVSSVA